MCKEFMKKRLLLFNTGTCTALYVTGDLIQQQIEGSKEVDWSRTLRMATLGVCMGPLNHGWYTMLDKILVGTAGKVVFKKVLADQLVMAPICCSFFYVGKMHFYVARRIRLDGSTTDHYFLSLGMCTLEGRGMAETKKELRTKFWPTYKVR